jgi:glycerol-3-phosphate responsive antiterminator
MGRTYGDRVRGRVRAAAAFVEIIPGMMARAIHEVNPSAWRGSL